MPLATVGQRLRQVRLHVFGRSSVELVARLLGYQSATPIHSYESGRTQIPLDKIDKFSRITNAPLIWLVRGEPENFDVKELAVYPGEVIPSVSYEQAMQRVIASFQSPQPVGDDT